MTDHAMDRARVRSAERDALRKPRAEHLDADLRRAPIRRPPLERGEYGRALYPICPGHDDGKKRTLEWDGYRGYWECRGLYGCGFTISEEERQELIALAAEEDDR